MDIKNIDIFTQFKNKNIQEEQIVKLLATATKEKHITEIEKYGCNLLFFAGLYDNDQVFKFLSENFADSFKGEFKKCVLLTYTNKNPNILRLSLNNMDASENEKEDLLKKFATSCFRNENIEITQNWLANNLNDKQLQNFVSQLFLNNNKPYLIQISKNPFWKKLIKQHDVCGDKNKELFYNTLVSENNISDKLIDIPSVKSENLIPSVDNQKQDLVVTKKRRKSGSLVAA